MPSPCRFVAGRFFAAATTALLFVIIIVDAMGVRPLKIEICCPWFYICTYINKYYTCRTTSPGSALSMHDLRWGSPK